MRGAPRGAQVARKSTRNVPCFCQDMPYLALCHTSQSLFMRCPQCQVMEHTCVLNTVHREDGVVRRRRGCRACQIRWTTYEDIEVGSLINAFVPRPVVGDGIEEGRRP